MKEPLIDTGIDGHVHTKLCHHARGEMEEYVQAAVGRRLRKLVFLEHLEVGISYFEDTWLTEDDFAYYHEEGRRLQDKYRGTIEIGLGIEVGYNPAAFEEIRRRLALHAWDRIGISYHFMASDSGHLNMVSSKQVNIDRLAAYGVDAVINSYYDALQDAVESLPGQVLCHADAVLRHHPGIVPQQELHNRIGTLLDAVARKNMALEVNTSGYTRKNEPYPSLPILKMAVARNIPLVAGSDAHRPEDVGRFFERLPNLVQQLTAG
jgi:histidinol-phosphatase (PHP family)